MGKQNPAGPGTEGTDQIQMPASGGSPIQSGGGLGSLQPVDPLPAVHLCGRGRAQASTRPPPPKQPERSLKLEETDLLLADLHQGPDLPKPEGLHLLGLRPAEPLERSDWSRP
jgi:hypothetical protein